MAKLTQSIRDATKQKSELKSDLTLESPSANSISKPAWCLSVAESYAESRATSSGLTAHEAADRSKRFGTNQLAGTPPRSAFSILFAQLKGFLNYILMAAVLFGVIAGDLKDAAMISAVVIFNTILGFFQEFRAEKTLEALKSMVAPNAQVRRQGVVIKVPAAEVVPGDTILLEAGDRVPADGRIVVAHALEIDESSLTGESVSTAKRDAEFDRADAPLADRFNMAYMGTVVTRGRGELLVTAIGGLAEIGKIASQLGEVKVKLTPLQIQLGHLGKFLALIVLAVVIVLAVFEYLRGESFRQMMMEAVALGVAAVPEGLPALVTVTLALGLRRMSKRHVIVKRLVAVETLGCTTVICSDKTGTLTMNQMTAKSIWHRQRLFTVSGEGYERNGIVERLGASSATDLSRVLIPAALCNDSQVSDGKLIGDPTEGALLVLAEKDGVDIRIAKSRYLRIAEVPFDSRHKFMATLHDEGGRQTIFAKGAPEVLLELCTRFETEHGPVAMTNELRSLVLSQNASFGGQGLRVVAIASRDAPALIRAGDLLVQIRDLDFQGLVGIMDPPRSEAKAAINKCLRAGIAVKMITGDHAATASAIARDLGIEGHALTGSDLDKMDDGELAECLAGTGIFARLSPKHKIRIVKALQAKSAVVAMTGDGVNDAPALKAADIGVAMGTGTEVAKEAATMILTDDNFATIVKAVEEGRTIYDNIVKFVRYQLSTNMGALLTVSVGPLFELPFPLQPIQILWVGMIMDGPPAIALGLEQARKGIMAELPRRTNARILTWSRLRVLLFYGSIMAAGTLGVLAFGVSDKSTEKALTMAFSTFVLFQFFNIFNARSETATAFGNNFFSNPRLWAALATVIALQVLMVHWSPLGSLFGTVPMTLPEWGLCTLVASSVLILEELRRLSMRPFWAAKHFTKGVPRENCTRRR
jgi:Ca2+-transporting ATPase